MRQSKVREAKVKFSIIVWEYLFWQVFADLCDVQYSVRKVVKFLKSIKLLYFFIPHILKHQIKEWDGMNEHNGRIFLFFLKLHCPKKKRNIRQNSALWSKGRICQIFHLLFFWQWSFKKNAFEISWPLNSTTNRVQFRWI